VIRVPESNELADFNLGNFSVPPNPRYTDRRGFMYVLEDKMFPEFIKVGRTTDCKKRLTGYNSDKPFPTAKMLFISEMFENVNEVERRILSYMYDVSAPSTLSKEWFLASQKQKIIDIITKAETLEEISRIGSEDREQHWT